MKDELYKLFGEIFENAQYIEWNIALITSESHNDNVDELFEKMRTMTMGKIIGYAKEIDYLGDEDIEELEYILEKRNYLAHQFFKINDVVKHSDNKGFLANKVRELKNILNRFQNFNEDLSDIYKSSLVEKNIL